MKTKLNGHKPANTQVLRDEKGKWKKGTPPPNPKGRPADGESWAGMLRWAASLTGKEAATFCPPELAKEFIKLGTLTLKEAVSLRVIAALLFDPDARLFNAVMDRAEGKLAILNAQVDWREEARRLGHDPQQVFDELVNAGRAALARGSDSRGVDGSADSGE